MSALTRIVSFGGFGLVMANSVLAAVPMANGPAKK